MYSRLLQNFILPLGSMFFGGNFHKELRKWERFDLMSEEELLAIQQKRLKLMLEYAVDHVPYYKSIGLSKDTPIDKWPILTKEILREYNEDLISTEFSKERLVKNYSSGSSGVQSFTYMTHEHRFLVRAIQTNWWKWGGYAMGEPLLQFGISPNRSFSKKLKDFFFRVSYQEAFSLTDEKMDRIIKKFQKNRSQHVAGYPSAINELAKRALKRSEVIPFRSLHSLGDKLFSHYRTNFNKAFDDPIIVNTYGCAEGYMMACKLDLDAYYVMSPHVYLEVVDDEGRLLEDGERGHILVTGLTNFAMPLIRYKLGDLGILLPKSEYPSNRRFAYPLLKEVTGRETDVVKTPNGTTLIVHSFTGIFEYVQEIKQYKIVHLNTKNLEIEYLTENGEELYPEVLNTLHKKLDQLVASTMKITFKKVSKISPSPSGKPQIIEVRKS